MSAPGFRLWYGRLAQERLPVASELRTLLTQGISGTQYSSHSEARQAQADERVHRLEHIRAGTEVKRRGQSDTDRSVFDDHDCRGVVGQVRAAEVNFPARKYLLGSARDPDDRPGPLI